jgi:hypothetical protein
MPVDPRPVKAPKPLVYPTVDPGLLAAVRAIYLQWTGKEFADAVGEIRRDTEAGRFTPKQ